MTTIGFKSEPNRVDNRLTMQASFVYKSHKLLKEKIKYHDKPP